MSDIFLSHASKDDARADETTDVLAAHGLSVWVDHRNGIVPGTPNWDATIRAAIKDSAAGVLLMSPRSLASDVCAAECLLVRELGRALYVACLDTCKPEEIWLTVKMIQWADLRADFTLGIAKLITAIRGTVSPADTSLPTAVRAKLTGSYVMRANLPYLSTVPLTGRDDDLAKIRGLLGPHTTQLIAVGGTGKSRIAAEIALAYPNGAIWHRCDELSDADQITEALRRHLGLPDKSKELDVLAALDDCPAPLIVVDNAEAVTVEQRTTYVEVLNRLSAHGAPTLLTARVVWDELKPRCDYHPLPISTEAAARVALSFAEAEGISLTAADGAALAETCHQHPRLIEFAVRQLHERDAERVILQVRELKHADVQTMLDEMIRRTVRQMAEQARSGPQAAALLPWLTVFRGSFAKAAVMALKPPNMDEDAADEALVTLQRWEFVRRESAGPRFRIEDVVNSAVPPVEGAAARHFAYYFSKNSNPDVNRNEEHHAQLQADWLNIHAAIDWGLAYRPKEAVDWAHALNNFMQLRLTREEWRWVLTSALAAAVRIGYVFGQANTHKALGDVARMENNYEAAWAAYSEAMLLYEAVGDRRHQATTYWALGIVAQMQADYTIARADYAAAMPLFEAIGDRLGQAYAHQALGNMARMQHDYKAAMSEYGAALSLSAHIGNFPVRLNSLAGLMRVEKAHGNTTAACDFYRQLMTLAASHSFFANHPTVESWRQEFADLGCG